MPSILDRIPRPSGDLYIGPNEEVVEKLWDSVKFNDAGEMLHLVIFLDEDDDLTAVEESVWHQSYSKEQPPTYEMNYYQED